MGPAQYGGKYIKCVGDTTDSDKLGGCIIDGGSCGMWPHLDDKMNNTLTEECLATLTTSDSTCN